MSAGDQYSTQKIIAALEKTRGGVYLAADEIGCSYKTIERRAEKVQAVREVIDKYRQRRSDVAEMKLETAILNGEPWAIKYQLSTIGKSRGYVERQEVTGKDGGAINVIIKPRADGR